MDTKGLQGKLVAILGYGMEGRAVTKYLIQHGIKPVLFDEKPWESWTAAEKEQIKNLGLNFIFGEDCLKELKGFDVAFRSPGINPSQLTINNLQLTSQTKWFFEHCPAKIIGVTGTKGKGTTCALIYQMMKAGEKNALLTGNIGKVQPLEILDSLKKNDWVVYELSSFQLQDLKQSPRIGVVLMVTSEHLDYHKDEHEYLAAKSAIVKFQSEKDFAIINSDFNNSAEIGKLGNGKKLFFSRNKEANIDCFVKNNAIIMANSSFHLPISKLQLRGEHNLENICAAVLVAKCADCSDESIVAAAINFKGLEHRLEFVAKKREIKFYNDSFSTTPETAIAAIKSFTEPLIVILGGSQKKSNFKNLGETIARSENIKSVILIGQEARRIKSAIGESRISIQQGAKNMEEIFAQIRKVAAAGDVVLLSPACASFDMFKNYRDRGEQFKSLAGNY